MTLKERREAIGLTQVEAAKAVGVDQSQISMYESGAYKPKTLAAVKLAELYGCTIAEIMEG